MDIKRRVNHTYSLIAQQRAQRGLTQKDLANMLGISQPYVAHIERGTRTMSISLCKKISRILDIKIEALVQQDVSTNKTYFTFNDIQNTSLESGIPLQYILKNQLEIVSKEEYKNVYLYKVTNPHGALPLDTYVITLPAKFIEPWGYYIINYKQSYITAYILSITTAEILIKINDREVILERRKILAIRKVLYSLKVNTLG